MESSATARRDRLKARHRRTRALGRLLYRRYSRQFWTLHSVWALLTGGVVLVLSHNRYGYLPWVVLFLALTWASTLFFSRVALETRSRRARLAHGVVSYITRVMYQETLFFLLPFYFYSTTFPSWNSFYVIGLALLAVLSCFDLVFDRLLRRSRAFSLAFFAIVTFSALQFFLPLLLHVQIHNGAYLAAGLSFFSAMPLAFASGEARQPKRIVAIVLALAAIVGVLKLARVVVPPVPLRLWDMHFGPDLDAKTMQMSRELPATIHAGELPNGRLYVRATIFSPGRLPVSVQLQFFRNGRLLRTSRTLDLVAHNRGFRVWDALRGGPGGVAPGRYTVEAWTGEGQIVGRGAIVVLPNGGAASAPRR
ncbi:MAG TPA: DUF5924 family protein [Thermoanaerobaculaceae bacterium]|nr:DUF5924 family protein [Thermoanaerobaculaceae bacterium]